MESGADDYERLKAFLGCCVARLFPGLSELDPDAHPLAALAKMEARTPRHARQGLTMAINDCLEMTAEFDPAEVDAFDADLAAQGLPTLSDVRLRFWRRIQMALKRGRIRGKTEHYAIRNAAEIARSDEERTRLWELVEEYEARAAT